MSVLVRDLRIIWDPFDAKTNLTFTTTNAKTDVVTTDPTPIEASASIGYPVDNGVEDIYANTTHSGVSSLDLDSPFGGLVYGWTLPQGNMAAAAASPNPGVGIQLGDGTNRQAFGLAGGDVVGFRHADDFPDWQCNVLDTLNLPAATFAGVGNDTLPSLSAITQIGHAHTTLSAAKGGAINVYSDQVMVCDSEAHNGIQLVADSANATGYRASTFDNIAVEDRSGVAAHAYGAVREVGAGAFSSQVKITFGDSANGDVGLDFQAQSVTFLYEDRGFQTVAGGAPAPRLGFKTLGPTGTSTPSTSKITFGTRTGTGTGGDGCTFVVPPGVDADIDFTNINFDTVGLYGSTFQNWYEINLRTDSQAAANQEIFQCTFVSCGPISAGRTEFKNNQISNTTATGADSAAVSFLDTANASGNIFVSGGTGHAFAIDSATPGQSFNITNFQYDGYAGASGNTGNEAFINRSGQVITLNISGGDSPTVDSDGVRARTIVVASSTITITGALGNSEVKVLPTSGSPYSGNSLGTQIASTETISADTTVGNGTNYISYSDNTTVRINANGAADFSDVFGDLANGDTIRVTVRDNQDNPSLQKYDTFTVSGTPTSTVIDTTTTFSGFTSVFGTVLSGSNSKTVTVEKVGASYPFTVTTGETIDVFVYRIGSDPILLTNQLVEATGNLPISQVGDRNYSDPA